MLLNDIVTAYQAAAASLSYTFVSGTLEDVINAPSNANRTEFLWLDRPVTGGFDTKLLRTKVGIVSYRLNLHSLQPYYQDLEKDTPKQSIYDNHTTRLINFLGEVHTENIQIAKALQGDSPTVFEHKIHMGKYIGVLVTLDYNLFYCV